MKKLLLTPLIAMVLALPVAAQDGAELTKTHKCGGCHKVDKKSAGPSYKDIAAKYAGNAAAVGPLATNIQKGSKGVWGKMPMPANKKVSDADAKAMAEYILGVK